MQPPGILELSNSENGPTVQNHNALNYYLWDWTTDLNVLESLNLRSNLERKKDIFKTVVLNSINGKHFAKINRSI